MVALRQRAGETIVDFKGRRALVTGASTGLGAVFARELAAQGADLVLVARSEDKLQALASELRAAHGVTIEVVAGDLSTAGAGAKLAAHLAERGSQVDVLINNAGFGLHGALAAADPSRMAEMVQLNVNALMELTAAMLPGMRTRDYGAIVNVASTAAFQPVPYMAVYGATKAFVLSFTEAVWAETKGTGVRVTTLCPGATETEFFATAGEDAQFSKTMAPEPVVAAAFTALDRGRPSVITGSRNWFVAQTVRFAPRRVAAGIAERAMRPKDAAISA